jgi:hypothetical protein
VISVGVLYEVLAKRYSKEMFSLHLKLLESFYVLFTRERRTALTAQEVSLAPYELKLAFL